MARYDVYPTPMDEGFLLDIQSDLLDGLNTRVVVPLLPVATAPKPVKTLNPRFEIAGRAVVMATQFMAAVPVSILRNPVGSLDFAHDDIVAAIDLLMHGF